MRRWRNEIGLSGPAPPGHYRKGSRGKRNRIDPGFRSFPQGDQNGDQAGGAEHFQGESGFGADRQFCRQRASAWQVYGLSSRLEESLRAVEGGPEDARIRRKPITSCQWLESRAAPLPKSSPAGAEEFSPAWSEAECLVRAK